MANKEFDPIYVMLSLYHCVFYKNPFGTLEYQMGSLNPFVSLNFGNKPWADQISKTLQTQLEVTIDTPPVSIFEIPKNLKAEKLEAYVPQRVGLGPNHHFHPELYRKIQQKKLSAVKRFLKPHQIHDCQQEIVEKVKEIVPIIRACYDFFLDAEDNTLAWLFAIDGMFLLDQVDAYLNHQRFEIETNDLIMLENQIPLIVLMEIQMTVWGEKGQDEKDNMESRFQFICKPRSPFHLSNENIDFSSVNHLLDYMYHSIVNNEKSISRELDFTNPESDASERDAKLELLEAVIKSAGLIPGAPPSPKIVEFVNKKFPRLTEEIMVKEIKVPSVSELGKIAKVKFCLSPRNEGIRNIKFVEGKERICYLPFINLNIDSEVILRNLVAYEKLMANDSFTTGYGLELTEYVDFMCGIIDTAMDVKLLRKEKIIEGDLDDGEIVKLFNGIGKSHVKMSVETDLRKIVTQLNKVYESTPRIWVRRLVEKQMRAWAKIITYLVSISGTLFLVREVYLKANDLKPFLMKLVHFLQTKFGHLLIFFIRRKGPDAFV